MKKILLIILSIFAIVSCSTNDDGFPASNIEVDITEGQQSWTKMALADRKAIQAEGSNSASYSATNCGVIFSDDTVALVYVNHECISPVAEIYRSTNAGNNWTKILTLNGTISDAKSQNGITAVLYRSGIQNYVLWSDNLMNSFVQNSINLTFTHVQVCNDSILLSTGNNGIYRSKNRGLSWVLTNNEPYKVLYRSDASQYYALQDGRVKVSTDTCKTFTTLYSGTDDFSSLFVMPDNSIFAGSENGDIYRSAPGGSGMAKKFSIRNLYPSATGVVVSDIRMIDAINGFAVMRCDAGINTGRDFEYTTGLIFRTADGGETWNLSYRSQLINFSSLLNLEGPNVIAAGYQCSSISLGKVYICITKTLGI